MRDRNSPPPRAHERSSFLRVRGRGAATLRVDPPSVEPAMCRGPHASITHLDRALDEPVRALVPALARALDTAPDRERATREVIETLRGAGLEVDRRDEPRTSIRKHPAARLCARAEHPLIDHELRGLELGMRAVAKRMCPPGGGTERVARFTEAGFAATWFGVTTHGARASEREVILVATDARMLAAAERVERALVAAAAARADDALAVREMGALLGYPACCVERFVSLRARDDASLAGALLGPLDVAVPFATVFTVPPFTLISHAPCSPWCEATRALVARLLASSDDATRASYGALARFAWGVDDDGMLVRAREGAAERIDPSDPELAVHAIEIPDRAALHWRISPSA